MDLTLTAEQRAMRSTLRELVRDLWPHDRLLAAADAPALDDGSWAALARLGLFGLTVPEGDGGMGLGFADAAVLFEELGRGLVPGPLVPTALAASVVPEAVTGKAVVAMLDVRDRIPVAEHVGSATHLVAVNDDGLFRSLAGEYTHRPVARPLDPLTPLSLVTLPHGLGERIGSAADAARWRAEGTVLTAALQVGVAQGALDLAVRYAGERSQFGRVIGSFQAVKHLLAESLVKLDLARAATLVAALAADDPDAEDADEAASAAKVLADKAATEGGRTCVQVHGGMGFTWEVPAHLYLKRAWLLATCFGDADEHAARLGAMLGRASESTS
ncbi:acyl-CoA dehydrogenase family protein [Actinospica sp.]|jgi:alkylation response protein AidB-like acyl-CoA dehydrogenase|uniref:acyl-CoA dehydrogenase family protein n=1 Tax=Actinospica sp. TaxID=1872142 RepID=UPI002BFAD38E|nr:acyl-CoA dehydrogenase family protein [Actinospica sp.]HWG23315.1 acyl-CoA dehydrogenase family protein [Actinospica sp.]